MVVFLQFLKILQGDLPRFSQIAILIKLIEEG